MGMYDELPVYKAGYDLFLEIFRFVRNFSREYKYTVGDSLKKEMMELMMLIYRANSLREKTDIIRQAREKVEVIRLLVRLMKDLREISLSVFVQVSEKIEFVSRQLTGWQKSVGRSGDIRGGNVL